MTDLRKAAEKALYALENESTFLAVEQYLLEQHAITFLKKALAQPEEDKRKWVGLTDDEIQTQWNIACQDTEVNPGWKRHIRFAKAIEAGLKEKNYGL
jgi:hypothetical protein